MGMPPLMLTGRTRRWGRRSPRSFPRRTISGTMGSKSWPSAEAMQQITAASGCSRFYFDGFQHRRQCTGAVWNIIAHAVTLDVCAVRHCAFAIQTNTLKRAIDGLIRAG